jgi:transposase
MTRAALESLDKETLICLVLAQAKTIAALTRQVEILTARVGELEARLGQPPKTPGNSSTAPSRGQKASEQAAGSDSKSPRKAHPGAHRPLHPDPTTRRDMMASCCQHCGTNVSSVPQIDCGPSGLT